MACWADYDQSRLRNPVGDYEDRISIDGAMTCWWRLLEAALAIVKDSWGLAHRAKDQVVQWLWAAPVAFLFQQEEAPDLAALVAGNGLLELPVPVRCFLSCDHNHVRNQSLKGLGLVVHQGGRDSFADLVLPVPHRHIPVGGTRSALSVT